MNICTFKFHSTFIKLITNTIFSKVLLKTTVGDIDIELWTREAPKACRNFIQLCMENYYNGTIFHRVVKDFIVQGGDPTGTGHGGESVYGHPFKVSITLIFIICNFFQLINFMSLHFIDFRMNFTPDCDSVAEVWWPWQMLVKTTMLLNFSSRLLRLPNSRTNTRYLEKSAEIPFTI